MIIEDIGFVIVSLIFLAILLGILFTHLIYDNRKPPPPPIIFQNPKHPRYYDELPGMSRSNANEPRTLNDAVYAINKWNNDRPDWAFKMVQADDEYSQHETKRRD